MIRKVSIPLVVGMIVAAGVGPSSVLAILSLTGVALMLLYLSYSPRPQALPYYLTFFLAGMFCYCSSGLVPHNMFKSPFGTGFLTDMIEGAGFPHKSTTGLMEALLTGDRSGLDKEITASFRQSGASHILALSGLHLGVIYALVSACLSALGNSPFIRRARAITVILISGAYALMTGAGPSIMRAFLFICINEIAALHPDRRKDNLQVLWTALTIQLVANPSVITSAGFQLSYLAVLGIHLCYPVLRDFYPGAGAHGIRSKLNPVRLIWNSAAMSLSCQLFTAPLAYVLFGTFPKYFLLTNLIALPLTELLISGGLTCVLLEGAGLCPWVLVEFVDRTAGVLTDALGIIARM